MVKVVPEWKSIELGDFITLKRGYDLPRQQRQTGAVPVVSSSGITDYHSQAMRRGPGVVTGRYGTLGEVFYVNGDYWPLNTTLYVSDFKGNHPLFVYYFLKTLDFQQFSDKAAVPGLNRNHLHMLKVTVQVDVGEQKRTAEILRSLDDKIELNRRMAATLEEMARAVFRSWFVDFDPVRAKVAAKVEGRDPERAAMAVLSGRSEVELNSLTAETITSLAAVPLPDTLEEVGGIELPSGWSVERLAALTSFLSRGLAPSYVEEGGMLVLNQRCVRSDGLDLIPARRHDVLKRAPKERTLQVGDVLVNSTGVGTLGRVAQVMSLPEPATVDSHVTIVRAMEAPMRHYLGLLLEGRQDEIESLGEGTTGQTELSRSKLGELPCIVPSTEMIQAFNNVVAPMRLASDQMRRENHTLAKVRDALLPKLLSGELQARAVEAEFA